MKNIKNYYTYIFISTITRNVVDVYSIIYLYKLGFLVKNIIFIYTLVYFLGIYLSQLSITIGNKIGYKYILILSSIITSITFYIITNSHNLYLISLFLSLSIYTYHPIKHYYGIIFLKHKKEIGNTLIFIYIATLLSSYIVINNMKVIYLIIISIIGIIPALFIQKESPKKITYPKKILKNKLNYFIFDQLKNIFILLEPLYLYLISNNLSYVGIFNIILTISSIICIYLLVTKINIENNYKYFNLIFTIVLILKLNILNKNLLLIIAIFEGVGIKINELVSTMNLYQNNTPNSGYIITVEKIFCLTRTIILGIIYFLQVDIKLILYILIVGIFILSFMYKNIGSIAPYSQSSRNE